VVGAHSGEGWCLMWCGVWRLLLAWRLRIGAAGGIAVTGVLLCCVCAVRLCVGLLAWLVWVMLRAVRGICRVTA
jgi:hypothetical protein